MHPAHLLAVKQRVLTTSIPDIAGIVARILRTDEPDRMQQLIEKLNAVDRGSRTQLNSVGAGIVGDAHDEAHAAEEQERQELQTRQRQDGVEERKHQKHQHSEADLDDAKGPHAIHQGGELGYFFGRMLITAGHMRCSWCGRSLGKAQG